MYKFTMWEGQTKQFVSSNLDNDMSYLPTQTTEGNSTYALDTVSVKTCPIGSTCVGSDSEVAMLFDTGWIKL